MIDLFYNFYGINKTIFIFINHVTNIGMLPYILQALTRSCYIFNGILYYLILCMFYYLKLKQKQNEHFDKFWIYYYKLANIGIIYTVFAFTYAALKFYIHSPRPFCSLPHLYFTTIGTTDAGDCSSSFPSAHTGMSVLIAYFLWPYIGRTWKIIACFIVILVGISRITLAMHYPADIIYSVIITSSLIITIGNKLYQVFKNNIIRVIGTYIYAILYTP